MSIFSRQAKYFTADMMKPQPCGVCDRTGFILPLSEMPFQYQYHGNALVNLNLRVGEQYLDRPSEFLRPPLIGPDPVPPRNPRPTHYAQQNSGGTTPPTVFEIEGYFGSDNQ